MKNLEIEARFLDIDPEKMKTAILALGADDLGEDHLEEIVFYDKALTWQADGKKFVRVRKNKKGVFVSYKQFHSETVDGTEEIQLKVDSLELAVAFLEKIGLVAYRFQEKRRHTFILDGVTLDIDWWPAIPPLIELEGIDEPALKIIAGKLGLDWSKAVFENAKIVIEKYYHIPVGTFRKYRFDEMG